MPSFASVGNVIKGVAGLLAVIPGLVLISKKLALPPELEGWLTLLALPSGVVIVLTIYLFARPLRRLSAQKVGLIVVALGIAGLVAVIHTQSYGRTHTAEWISPEGELERLVVPVPPKGRLVEDLRAFNNDYGRAVQDVREGRAMRAEVVRQATPALWHMALAYLLSQSLLLAAIVIGAWKIADAVEHRRPSAAP